MRDETALRVALSGSGRISDIHGHNIANHPQLELAVVCSRNTECAQRLASRYGAEAFTNSAEVFTDDWTPWLSARQIAHTSTRCCRPQGTGSPR